MKWWAALSGRRRSERSRCQGFRAPAACSPAAPRAGLSSCPSLRTLSDQPLPTVRCSCRPGSRLQSLGSRHLIGRLRGHAKQEFAHERRVMASGSVETTRSKRRSRMLRERELGRWCKTSPQILSDPKSLLHVPSNLSLVQLYWVHCCRELRIPAIYVLPINCGLSEPSGGVSSTRRSTALL